MKTITFDTANKTVVNNRKKEILGKLRQEKELRSSQFSFHRDTFSYLEIME